jgi:hypothetical protein
VPKIIIIIKPRLKGSAENIRKRIRLNYPKQG